MSLSNLVEFDWQCLTILDGGVLEESKYPSVLVDLTPTFPLAIHRAEKTELLSEDLQHVSGISNSIL